MKRFHLPLKVSFKTFLVGNILSALLLSLFMSSLFMFLVRRASIERNTIFQAEQASLSLVTRTEELLIGMETSLKTLLDADFPENSDELQRLLKSYIKMHINVRAVYLINSQGRTYATGERFYNDPTNENLTGIDFSYIPLFRQLNEIPQAKAVWSDKFLSPLTADTAIAVGFKYNGKYGIAELALSDLVEVISTASDPGWFVWVIDRRSELVAETGHAYNSSVRNIRNYTFVDTIMKDEPLPDRIHVDKLPYHPAFSRSEKLGWIFITKAPAGINNILIRYTLWDIALLSIIILFLYIGFLPFWTRILSKDLYKIAALSDQLTLKLDSSPPAGLQITEFRRLSGKLTSMALRIREREESLKKLNKNLEDKVRDRTEELKKNNDELKESLETQKKMKGVLVKSEKMAALGRLVAGVSHELNTPIGNAVMAVSSMQSELNKLEKEISSGLTKASFERFISYTRQGLEISEKNLDRSIELIGSFKNIASDQTNSIRRSFKLKELLNDVVVTMAPMINRSPQTLELIFPGEEDSVEMDSYPGTLSQILTNLISNALTHAWDEKEKGVIEIQVKDSLFINDGKEPLPAINITVSDNGKGIDDELAEKIFDPFFTTRMGQGGTGLGLNIAANNAENILGGRLSLKEASNEGSSFLLEIPLVAPDIGGKD